MEEEPHEVSFASKAGPTFEASLYEPPFSEEKRQSPREKLNDFLASRDISPIRHSLDKPWIEASEGQNGIIHERRDKLLLLV